MITAFRGIIAAGIRTINSRLVVGAAIPVGIGLLLTLASGYRSRFQGTENWLARASYDLGFRFRPTRPVPDAVIIEINDDSLATLGYPIHRSNYVHLIDRLIPLKPKLVFFDVVFEGTNEDSRVDAALADRIRVVEVGVIGAVKSEGIALDDGTRTVGSRHSLESLSTAGRWGYLDHFHDPDNAIRQFRLKVDTGPDDFSAAWVAAELRAAAITTRSNATNRRIWLNYYGPTYSLVSRSSFQHRSLRDVLADSEAGLKEMENKFIFVGFRLAIAQGSRQVVDYFRNPAGGAPMPGVEVHATAVMNLCHDEWMECLWVPWQLLVVVAWGFVVAGAVVWPTWRYRWSSVMGGAVAIGVVSLLAQWYFLVWWPWLIAAAVQPGAGIILGLLQRSRPMLTGGRPELSEPAIVFISYRADDGEECARSLQQALAARQIRAFVAPGELRAGTNFPDELLRRVESAANFLLVLTPLARESLVQPRSWIAREVRHAMTTRRHILVVRSQTPPLHADTDPLPRSLRALARTQDLEYSSGRFFHAFMDELIAGLRLPGKP